MTFSSRHRWVSGGSFAALLTVFCSAVAAGPSFDAVRQAWRPSDLPVLDRHGVVLQTVRVDGRARRLAWVPLTEVSPALMAALVHGEDKRFWQHSGVDWAGLARSAWQTTLNQRTQGGSTLTMQLAGLLDADLARPSGGRTVLGKVSQMSAARELEAAWRKSEILEAYLNLVPLRGELVGVAAASQTLFGKHPSGLDAQEGALLAALVRAPNAKEERVAERACGLLRSLAGQAEVPAAQALQDERCHGLPLLAATAMARPGVKPMGEQIAPHAARWLWAQTVAASKAGPRGPMNGALPDQAVADTTVGALARAWPAHLQSTLDARLQRIALRALREQLGELQQRQVTDGAVVVLDNASGEVLAWVGSPGLMSQAPLSAAGKSSGAAPDVDAALARRQPGSTLKPFVYGLALERRLITPASLLHDAPTQLAAGAGLYLPQNYNHRYRGWVPVREALASSLNIPAVQVGAMVGPDALFERLNTAGLRISHSGGFHGYALALGSAEVSLMDLTNAYRSLAQQGRWSPWGAQPTPSHGAAQARTVFSPEVAFLLGDMLADNAARAPTFGLDSPLVTRGFAAVKTGTSKDMRDNWCVGYTQRYTVGVWVGNARGTPMQRVSGTAGAAPIWHTVVQRLHEGQPSQTPTPPAGLVQVALQQAGQARRSEWFVQGTEPENSLLSSQAVVRVGAPQRFGIKSPVPGSIYALDPDMPPDVQRIVLDGEPGEWWLNGQRLGRTTAAQPTLAWAPWPGRHHLALRAADGREIQSLRFEVRGATLKPGALPPSHQKARASG
ncbi:MAG: penicillin-binding protein 1C [Ideonella sp. MAG2]|nr:MAG: penicillin-binding protein 1C [Ideonella sp. MAG2]